MKTIASTKTYHNVTNLVARLSHKEIIFKLFNYTNGSYTIREVSKALKWDYTRVQKRMTDLFNSDLLKIIGTKKEEGNPNSIYTINRMPEIFKKKKLTRLDIMKKVLDKYLDSGTYDAILEEYERVIKL